jgi:hypothetical protein
MIIVQDENDILVSLLKLTQQICQDGRERGASCECNRAKAVCPTVGKLVRRAAMTEVQKRVGSRSSSSSESQAKTVWGDCLSCIFSSLALMLCAAATQAESRVVFPLPAEALTSVKGYACTASSSLSKRERSTSQFGRRGADKQGVLEWENECALLSGRPRLQPVRSLLACGCEDILAMTNLNPKPA